MARETLSVLLVIWLGLTVGCSVGNEHPTVSDNASRHEIEQSAQEYTAFHSAYFGAKEQYEKYYAAMDTAPEVIQEKVYGGIVPHHLFVGSALAEYYSALSNQNPEVIVVVGPNHMDTGKSEIITSKLPYKTPYGFLETDVQLIDALLTFPLVRIDDRAMALEHSISSEVAFLKKTFPDATLVPIALDSHVDKYDAERLGNLLTHILPKNSLVLASVDFSHYQPEIVADLHDKTSRATIANFNFDFIYDLEIDSPASIYTLLTYLSVKDAQHITYENHTNSASFSNQPDMEETTSHLFMAFTEGAPEQSMGIGMLFFGDSVFDRGVKEIIDTEGKQYIFGRLRGAENRFFVGNHFNVLNLEGPMTTLEDFMEKEVIFNNDIDYTLNHLNQGLFDVVNLANNHQYDFFEAGALETHELLSETGITTIGYASPCSARSVDAYSVAICGYNAIDQLISIDDFVLAVREAKENNDTVVVSIHWGYEYVPAANDMQADVAHMLVDAGADAIIGHHPHVVQPFEIYKNKPIIYSTGNFIFDQTQPETQLKLGVGMFFEDNQTTVYFYPILSQNMQLYLQKHADTIPFYETYLKEFTAYTDKTALLGKITIADF